MSKVTYILFGLMVIGLSVSLFLYQQSRTKSDIFLKRTNVVKEVLLLLERTEKLKNILRKTIYDKHRFVDSTYLFTAEDKSEIDSALFRLNEIVLYEDQRLRIDTIHALVNRNFETLLKSQPDSSIFQDQISKVILRARSYAEFRLRQQQESYDNYQTQVTLWINAILISSFCLFLLGVWSTVAERASKANLKYLHESILTTTSNGICVFEMTRHSIEKPKIIFSNVGAVVNQRSGKESIVDLSKDALRVGELQDALRLVFVTGKTIIKEYEHHTEEAMYWLIVSISRIGERNVVMNYQDITPLKQMEKELRSRVNELESVNNDLEQFAHATSHDLKEPFRKIQIMADLLDHGPNPESHSKYVKVIARAAAKGSQLVEQILNYSKVQFDKSDLTKVDINEVIENVKEDLELLILEKGAVIRCGRLPVIAANRIQITQLFLNIIGNALKFSAAGRAPEIKIECVEVAGGDIPRLNSDGRYYAISVMDNGIGFDERYSSKIFDAFQRLNTQQDYAGFGLGLSLCKKIVINHGGSIAAKSQFGKGSTFTIYLPHLEYSDKVEAKDVTLQNL